MQRRRWNYDRRDERAESLIEHVEKLVEQQEFHGGGRSIYPTKDKNI
ncbi:MAG: hypothetical protein ACLTN0_06160 [Coprococcus phoceensis]